MLPIAKFSISRCVSGKQRERKRERTTCSFVRLIDNAINLHVFRGEMKKEREEEEEEEGEGEEKEKRKGKMRERGKKKGGRERERDRKKEKLGKRIRFRREANDHGRINVITILAGKRGCPSVCRKEFSPRFNVHFAWN